MKQRSMLFFLCLVMSVVLSACSTGDEETQIVERAELTELLPQEISWRINYELPETKVKILVNREGYATNREKIAYFLGEELNTNFHLVDASSKQIVYTGTIRDQIYNQDTGDFISQGDFSEFTQEGIYYIETDYIGQSYRFKIQNDVYETIFSNMLQYSLFKDVSYFKKEFCESAEATEKDYTEAINKKDVYEDCMTFYVQALSILYYPECYEKTDIGNGKTQKTIEDLYFELEWLLQLQKKNGGVYKGIYQDDQNQKFYLGPVNHNATAAFCGTMAIGARIFEKVDKEAARQYEAAARKAWNYLAKEKEDTAVFFADANILWLTKDNANLKRTSLYLQEHNIEMEEDLFALYGMLAYMSAETKTDTENCAIIMRHMMEITENAGSSLKKESYHAYPLNDQKYFKPLFVITIVNYIVPSSEYAKNIENEIHYLLGRNETGYRFIDQDGRTEWMKNPSLDTQKWNGIIRFMLSSLLSSK